MSAPACPRSRLRPRRGLAIAALLAALAGCAAPAPVEMAALPELPLVTNDQLFEFRWAIEREPAVTRAVGLATVSPQTEFYLTLALFGLDPQDRIVSRAQTYVQSDFSRRPVPFAIEVKPSGREARYELRVLDYYVTGIRND